MEIRLCSPEMHSTSKMANFRKKFCLPICQVHGTFSSDSPCQILPFHQIHRFYISGAYWHLGLICKTFISEITTPRTVTSPLQLTDSNSYYTKDHRTTKKAFTTDMSQLYWPNCCCEVFWKSFLDPSDLLSLVFFFIKWVKVCLPCHGQQRPFNRKIEGLLQVG